MAGGGIISSNITDLGESSIEKNSKKTDARIIDLTKPEVGVSNVLTEKIKSLPTIRTRLKPHCIERCAERGITKTMAEKVVEKGLRYYILDWFLRCSSQDLIGQQRCNNLYESHSNLCY